MPKPYAEKRGKGEYPWRVRWPLPPDANGVVKWPGASGFATEDDALEHGYKQLLAIKNGTWVDPRKSATPFGEFGEKWLAGHRRSIGTNDNRAYLFATILKPRWGIRPLAELNWDEIKEWANALPIPRNTVNNACGLMSAMLTSAVDAKMLGANPMAGRRRNTGVKQPANLAPKVVIWPTAHQSAAVAARLSRVEGIMQIFQTFMGPRVNEMLALHRKTGLDSRTDMVDGRPWKRRVMLVNKEDGSLETVEVTEEDEDGKTRTRRRLCAAPPKNFYSVREVDIPPFLDDLLTLHLADWPHDHVFASLSGAFRYYSNFDKNIATAAAGWPESPRRSGTRGRAAAEPILPGLASQGNRHGHATMMADWGLPEVLRRRILGQKMPGMAGVYEHPTPAMRRRRVDLLEDLWWSEGVADVYLAGPNAVRIDRREQPSPSHDHPQTAPKPGA